MSQSQSDSDLKISLFNSLLHYLIIIRVKMNNNADLVRNELRLFFIFGFKFDSRTFTRCRNLLSNGHIPSGSKSPSSDSKFSKSLTTDISLHPNFFRHRQFLRKLYRRYWWESIFGCFFDDFKRTSWIQPSSDARSCWFARAKKING